MNASYYSWFMMMMMKNKKQVKLKKICTDFSQYVYLYFLLFIKYFPTVSYRGRVGLPCMFWNKTYIWHISLLQGEFKIVPNWPTKNISVLPGNTRLSIYIFDIKEKLR